MTPANRTIAPRRTAPRRVGGALLACAALVVPVAGCGGAGGGGGDAGASRSGPVTSTPATPSTTPASPAPPTSDVKGRGFDVGTVTSVKTVAGTLVLALDRWTVKGVDDAQLAKDGVPATPHTGDRFENQNDDRTRAVPVAPGAVVVVNECVKAGDRLGMRSTPQDAAAWLKKPDTKAVLLLTYDEQGRVTRMDTDARC